MVAVAWSFSQRPTQEMDLINTVNTVQNAHTLMQKEERTSRNIWKTWFEFANWQKPIKESRMDYLISTNSEQWILLQTMTVWKSDEICDSCGFFFGDIWRCMCNIVDVTSLSCIHYLFISLIWFFLWKPIDENLALKEKIIYQYGRTQLCGTKS